MSDLAVREDVSPGAPAERAASAQAPVPLTERVIAALPGPRLFWTVLWAGWILAVLMILRSLAPAQLLVFFDPDETTATFSAVVGATMLVFLLGVRRLGRDVAALIPSMGTAHGRTHERRGTVPRRGKRLGAGDYHARHAHSL